MDQYESTVWLTPKCHALSANFGSQAMLEFPFTKCGGKKINLVRMLSINADS